MAQSSFTLSWESHRNNICNGLSSLQQNAEFVDMTLAADGHLVKVHQMIMALASPYIKELIKSANCPHPVVFLNKISYTTLSLILEYIYTGEVLVSMENLSDLVEAAKELHIKGLEDMNLQQQMVKQIPQEKPSATEDDDNDMEDHDDDSFCYFEVAECADSSNHKPDYTLMDDGVPEDSSEHPAGVTYSGMVADEDSSGSPATKRARLISEYAKSPGSKVTTPMQYTVSNQGSIQMILNRYVYYLKHSNRNRSRQWRCVDYLNPRKCPAFVVTVDDVVTQRIQAHTHPFHDKRILKKVSAGAVFTAIQEAENQGCIVKQNSSQNTTKTKALTENEIK